jgi:hypothetical protein
VSAAADAELALGEVAALALKAARGAGLSWGMAEEASDAVRVLHANGLPGVALLCAVLAQVGRADDPLMAGAALSDRVAALCADGPESLPPLCAPALLLPFVLRAARLQGRALRVTGGGMAAICLPDGGLAGDVIAGAQAVPLSVARATPPLPARLAPTARAIVAQADWARLQDWAARTYAPATEASRLRGAGEGERDTD